MFKWFLVTHNLHSFQMVTRELRALDVEFYSPVKMKVTKRADCNAVRTTETQLFPGYLFVRLNPELIHTSTISAIPGIREFVRFGGDICTVSNSLIEALKLSLLLRVDHKIIQIEFRNASPETVANFEKIALIKCTLARQAAFFEFLLNDKQLLKSSQPLTSESANN